MAGPFICTKLNHIHPSCFVISLVEIGPMVLEKKMKMCKVYENNNENNDDNDDGQRTNSDQKSSLELSGELKQTQPRERHMKVYA